MSRMILKSAFYIWMRFRSLNWDVGAGMSGLCIRPFHEACAVSRVDDVHANI